MKAKFLVFVAVAENERLGVNVHIRRFTEQFGNVEQYRQKWNQWAKREPQFRWRGLVWSEGGEKTGGAMPNIARFLDGTDETSVYGGDYTTGNVPAEFDVNGDLVNPGREGTYHPDDDYM